MAERIAIYARETSVGCSCPRYVMAAAEIHVWHLPACSWSKPEAEVEPQRLAPLPFFVTKQRPGVDATEADAA